MKSSPKNSNPNPTRELRLIKNTHNFEKDTEPNQAVDLKKKFYNDSRKQKQ